MTRPAIALATIALLSGLGSCESDPGQASVPDREPRTGAAIYNELCDACHQDPLTKAPSLLAMSRKSRAAIRFALTNGKMREQAGGLAFVERERLVEYISDIDGGDEVASGDRCAQSAVDLSRHYALKRGFDDRASAAVDGLVSNVNSENVGELSLKWAFALPGATEARSQPVIAGDTLFVSATTGGDVFALDRRTGCIRWHARHASPVRTPLTLLPGMSPPLLVFGDAASIVVALDATSGEEQWQQDVSVSRYSILTGGIVPYDGSLIVPVSLYEVALAQDPDHECCKAHGAIHRLDAATGTITWTFHTTSDAEPTGVSSRGVQQYGPSGAPVWSTPTVDAQRGLIYAGTGQNASPPATGLSDAVIALRLEDGALAWSFQATRGDVFNNACIDRGPNCPKWAGPDYDFGAAVIMARSSEGKPMLLAGQKSGDVFALDPDAAGAVLWRERVGSGSALGGVHWGMALRGDTLYAAANDPPYPMPGYNPAPGVYALDVTTGEKRWSHPFDKPCDVGMMSYFQRRELYPACAFFYGASAALTIASDVVFAPALDGRVRALAASSGRLLWQYDTLRPFRTVNGAEGHGGSMDNAGVTFAGDMVYMMSGYELFGELPGNVLLAFSL